MGNDTCFSNNIIEKQFETHESYRHGLVGKHIVHRGAAIDELGNVIIKKNDRENVKVEGKTKKNICVGFFNYLNETLRLLLFVFVANFIASCKDCSALLHQPYLY